MLTTVLFSDHFISSLNAALLTLLEFVFVFNITTNVLRLTSLPLLCYSLSDRKYKFRTHFRTTPLADEVLHQARYATLIGYKKTTVALCRPIRFGVARNRFIWVLKHSTGTRKFERWCLFCIVYVFVCFQSVVWYFCNKNQSLDAYLIKSCVFCGTWVVYVDPARAGRVHELLALMVLLKSSWCVFAFYSSLIQISRTCLLFEARYWCSVFIESSTDHSSEILLRLSLQLCTGTRRSQWSCLCLKISFICWDVSWNISESPKTWWVRKSFWIISSCVASVNGFKSSLMCWKLCLLNCSWFQFGRALCVDSIAASSAWSGPISRWHLILGSVSRYRDV